MFPIRPRLNQQERRNECYLRRAQNPGGISFQNGYGQNENYEQLLARAQIINSMGTQQHLIQITPTPPTSLPLPNSGLRANTAAGMPLAAGRSSLELPTDYFPPWTTIPYTTEKPKDPSLPPGTVAVPTTPILSAERPELNANPKKPNVPPAQEPVRAEATVKETSAEQYLNQYRATGLDELQKQLFNPPLTFAQSQQLGGTANQQPVNYGYLWDYRAVVPREYAPLPTPPGASNAVLEFIEHWVIQTSGFIDGIERNHNQNDWMYQTNEELGSADASNLNAYYSEIFPMKNHFMSYISQKDMVDPTQIILLGLAAGGLMVAGGLAAGGLAATFGPGAVAAAAIPLAVKAAQHAAGPTQF